jgi:hypothetical protein
MKRSESITKVATALHKARAAFLPITRDKINPHFRSKYADLACILDAIRDGFAANDLVLLQPTEETPEGTTVETVILHAPSGEWIGSSYAVKWANRDDAQGKGAGLTYARRFALSSLLGVAADDDDDGNAASARRDQPPRPEPPRTPPQPDASAWHHWVQTQAKSKGVEPKHLVNHLAKTFCEAGLSPDGKAAVLRGMHADQSQRVRLIADIAKWDPTASKPAATADSDPDMP